MDLNTGTPIQPTGNPTTPTPQVSRSLPPIMSSSNVEPSQPLPPTSESPSFTVPPVSQSPLNPSTPATTTNEQPAPGKPSFLDPLAMLKQMASGHNAPAEPAKAPVQQAASPVIPSTPEKVQTQPVAQVVTEVPVMPQQPQAMTQEPVLTPAMPSVTSSATPQMAQAPVGNIPVSGQYDIMQLLDLVVAQEASDLHLVVGYQPMLRIDGDLVTVGSAILTPQMAKDLIYAILPDDKKEQLEVNREVDLAHQHKELGRFRINAYWQRGYLSAAFRLIPTRIRAIDELKLPDLFHKFTDLEQGLVLVTGPTGHGKSTTLAAVIQEINMKHPKHILTIEDPVEYVFPQQKALVSQRELGDDTHSWKGALRSALREDPDVVLVGEMRDLETISSAITVAETGHLVFATLHTNNAAQTVQRIVNMYPDVQQDEIRSALADVLEAVVAQRLIPVKGGGRRAALEIMLMTPAIRNLIRENKIFQIDNIIRTSLDLGMTTLERSLLNLYKDGLIQQEDALRYALDATEMARLLEELV